MNANTCTFKTINKDNSYFYKKNTLGYLLTRVPYHLNVSGNVTREQFDLGPYCLQ